MSDLSNFIANGPRLCGAVNHERWADQFVHAFEKEKADHESVYAHKEGETIEDRLEVLYGIFSAKGVNPAKAQYFIDTLRLASAAYAVSKGRVELTEKVRTLTAVLTAQEADNEELASVLSVSAASTLSQW